MSFWLKQKLWGKNNEYNSEEYFILKYIFIVSNLDDEIIITKNGRPAAVLVTPEEFEGWKETILIHSNPDFVKEIKKGIKTLKNKKAKLYALGPRAYIYEETYRLLKKNN